MQEACYGFETTSRAPVPSWTCTREAHSPPKASRPSDRGASDPVCHAAQKQGTQSRAVPAHNSSGEICPLQSPIPWGSSEAPLQPPGRSAVTHRPSRPGGTSPSQGEPPPAQIHR